jgi:hypothetical protein
MADQPREATVASGDSRPRWHQFLRATSLRRRAGSTASRLFDAAANHRGAELPISNGGRLPEYAASAAQAHVRQPQRPGEFSSSAPATFQAPIVTE